MKTLGDIASVTPGVDFRAVGYSNWFTIRGISQNAGGGVAGLGPNTTAIYVDDAPLQARYANAAVPTAVPMFSTSITSRYCAGRRARCSVRALKAAQYASSLMRPR